MTPFTPAPRALALALLVAIAGCVGGAPRDNMATDPSHTTQTGEATIHMANMAYSPTVLTVAPGTTVTWINDDSYGHTVTPADKAQWGTDGSGDSVASWLGEGATWSHTFTEEGTYDYYCVPHAAQGGDGKWQGMVGTIVVSADGAADPAEVFTPPATTVVPSPVAPALTPPDADGIVRFTLTTDELAAPLDDHAAYEFWTFDGTVPGPMLRVREGDMVEITLVNPAESRHAHNIDLHAVTGPGGGAGATMVAPGESAAFRFRAIHPGLFVYHCATAPVPAHIANGMFGMILVEPKEGLAPMDREFYVVQGELYTNEPAGSTGLLSFSPDKLRAEEPEFFLFNGKVGALTGDGALTAKVGDSVRVFFGVGGAVPSSFHVIGEVFDRVYPDGNGPPSEHRQTILVPAAGAAMIEFDVEYPGTYVLVDHTLSRAFDKGAAGHLIVEGDADPDVFQE